MTAFKKGSPGTDNENTQNYKCSMRTQTNVQCCQKRKNLRLLAGAQDAIFVRAEQDQKQHPGIRTEILHCPPSDYDSFKALNDICKLFLVLCLPKGVVIVCIISELFS